MDLKRRVMHAGKKKDYYPIDQGTRPELAGITVVKVPEGYKILRDGGDLTTFGPGELTYEIIESLQRKHVQCPGAIDPYARCNTCGKPYCDHASRAIFDHAFVPFNDDDSTRSYRIAKEDDPAVKKALEDATR